MYVRARALRTQRKTLGAVLHCQRSPSSFPSTSPILCQSTRRFSASAITTEAISPDNRRRTSCTYENILRTRVHRDMHTTSTSRMYKKSSMPCTGAAALYLKPAWRVATMHVVASTLDACSRAVCTCEAASRCPGCRVNGYSLVCGLCGCFFWTLFSRLLLESARVVHEAPLPHETVRSGGRRTNEVPVCNIPIRTATCWLKRSQSTRTLYVHMEPRCVNEIRTTIFWRVEARMFTRASSHTVLTAGACFSLRCAAATSSTQSPACFLFMT
jgi:hypothetical protein